MNNPDRRTVLKMMAGGSVAAAGAALLSPLPAHAATAAPDANPLRCRGRTLFVRAGADAGNNGSSPSRPLPTLQLAADVSEPGDTVLVMNGTYRDTDTPGADTVLLITRSGLPDAPITFRAYPGHCPVVRVSDNAWQGIMVMGAAYITVEGFTVIGNNQVLTYDEAFATQDGSNPKFNANGMICRKDATTGATPHHITFRDNQVRYWPGGGIASLDTDYTTIVGNTVHSNAWYSVYANSGITIVRPTSVDATTGYRNFIDANFAHDNQGFIPWHAAKRLSDGNGIIVDTTRQWQKDTGQPYLGRTRVSNNISFSNGGSGIHAFECDFVDIVNNTVYDNSRSPTLHYAGLGAWHCGSSNVLNNVVMLRTGEPTNNNAANVDVVYDYNIYFNGQPPEVTGSHDLIADPLLVSPSNTGAAAEFRPRRGSPAIDSGTPRLAPRTDYTGRRRPVGRAIDRGAFEGSAR